MGRRASLKDPISPEATRVTREEEVFDSDYDSSVSVSRSISIE